ncbi:PREDICTED: binding partner of ACD11 1-like isoform X2 [Lupinus angustifolius]|uniref:binding partner of ACD11 1-like isoform X2 n=1 Tax=Lupinus angustifolius TaxID=3871 RepID=UPI00092E57E5|nr:PREDICTED: binding partner of ACD11 1-like isoform X2 [Lupinus angustifolius]
MIDNVFYPSLVAEGLVNSVHFFFQFETESLDNYIMYPGGYTAEVTSLSPNANENDVCTFFAYCGVIEHVGIVRSGEYACTAYVTFRDAYALETALLLNGSMILDQCICISRCGAYIQDCDNWNSYASSHEESIITSKDIHMNKFVSSPGEAIILAQEVVKTMVAKGYVLGKDAFVMARAFDESHNVSSSTTAKVAELSNKIGLTNTINSGIENFKSLDEKYHVTDITKSAVTFTGTTAIVVGTVTSKAAMATGNAIINSSYFAKGALWVSDMLARAAKGVADLGQHNK